MASKLTKEEKAALKEAKKAQKAYEAEMARRKVHLDHLSREVDFTRKNQILLNKQYRNELMKLKLTAIKQDGLSAWQKFDRCIYFKDFQISLMLDEIEEAQEQSLTNFTGHAESIDTLLTLLDNRIGDLKQEYLNDLNNMRAMDADEMLRFNEKQFQDEGFFKQLLYQLEIEAKTLEKNSSTEHQNKMDVEENKASEGLQDVRIVLEKRLENLWASYTDVLLAYRQRTNEKKKVYRRLLFEDTKNASILSYQVDKIASLYESIKKFKEKYATIKEEQQKKLDDLYKERKFFSDSFWTLRGRLKHDLQVDRKKLMALAVENNNSVIFLKKIFKKGEKLLNLAQICRHLETQNEKVYPFHDYQHEKKIIHKPPVKAVYQTIVNHIPNLAEITELALLWHRIGIADASRVSINEERETLKRENAFLRKKLSVFCETAAYINPYVPKPKENLDVNEKIAGKIPVQEVSTFVHRII